MDQKMDVLFINPGNATGIYQDLAEDYSAIEPPTWSLLLAESCRSVGYKVGIIDANAEKLSLQTVADKVKKYNPRLICLVVYGQNVNAGTTNMSGAVAIAASIKENNIKIPISMVGSYIQALPIKTLNDEKCIDFGFTNEGVYALRNILSLNNISEESIKDIN